MKTITTREYDSEGRLVRETTVTEVEVQPRAGSVYPAAKCTCTAWCGVVPPPPCPVHGQATFPQITCTSNTAQMEAVVEQALTTVAGRAHYR